MNREASIMQDVTDISQSLRAMRRNRGSTVIVILLLSFGIRTTTLIFSALNVLELRPLPVKHPDQLVQFTITVLGNPTPVTGVGLGPTPPLGIR